MQPQASDYKRRRIELQEEEKRSKMAVATHEIDYKETIAVMFKQGSETKKATYYIPTLIDVQGSTVVGSKLFRAPTPFDSQELKKKAFEKSAPKSFAML